MVLFWSFFYTKVLFFFFVLLKWSFFLFCPAEMVPFWSFFFTQKSFFLFCREMCNIVNTRFYTYHALLYISGIELETTVTTVCEALRCSQANLVRWEGLGTRSVPPLFAYLPYTMLTMNDNCKCSYFFPFSSNVSLHVSGHDKVWLLTLRRTSATSPQQQLFLVEVSQKCNDF